MTGFGSATGTVGRVHVDVEVRTVNHRFFNPAVKLPAAFAGWEGDVREVLRSRIAEFGQDIFPRDIYYFKDIPTDIQTWSIM